VYLEYWSEGEKAQAENVDGGQFDNIGLFNATSGIERKPKNK